MPQAPYNGPAWLFGTRVEVTLLPAGNRRQGTSSPLILRHRAPGQRPGVLFSPAVNQTNLRVNREGESLARIDRVFGTPGHSLVNRCPGPGGAQREGWC